MKITDTQKKYLIVGIIFFALLIAAEIFQLYFYHERSSRELNYCLTRLVELERANDICFPLKSASDTAFSSATWVHILTYTITFFMFIIVGSRLDRAEKRIEELERRET